MTQTSSEVLAKQNFLFVSKDTFLSQQKGLNGFSEFSLNRTDRMFA